jgi:SAM-dependent methyltransferase
MSEDLDYSGRDLEAMSWAVNYHRWILKIFEPYLGQRLVEVGAGTGSFSELLLELRPDSLALVEPSPAMYQRLTERLKIINTTTQIATYPTTFKKSFEQIRLTHQPDSIIYVNVLEHIADDEAELRIINQTLDNGGRVFLFVPALSWLFGPFDKLIGHHRRYSLAELVGKCTAAGFLVRRADYFDFFGVLPWWIKYRVCKSDQLGSGAVQLYDRLVVRIATVLESFLRPPIGKNIVLVAEKP